MADYNTAGNEKDVSARKGQKVKNTGSMRKNYGTKKKKKKKSSGYPNVKNKYTVGK